MIRFKYIASGLMAIVCFSGACIPDEELMNEETYGIESAAPVDTFATASSSHDPDSVLQSNTEGEGLEGVRGLGGINTRVFTTRTIYVECESLYNEVTICPIPSGGSVSFNKRYSSAPCYDKWSTSLGLIGVSDGCRARFKVTYPQALRVLEYDCLSNNNKPNRCTYYEYVKRSPIWVRDRYSSSYCREGSHWDDYDTHHVDSSVRNGCRAQFQVVIQ